MVRVLLAMLSLSMILPSCKRGDDDPTISLRSRKNRISGEWTVVFYQETSNYGSLRSVRYALDSNIVYGFEDSLFVERVYSWTMSINRDGEYTSVINEVFPFDSTANTLGYTEVKTEIGDWEFVGGNGERSKSQLLMLPTQNNVERSNQGSNIDIETISGPVHGTLYSINRLSNTELWLSYDETVTLPFEVRNRTFELRLKKEE